MAGLVLATTACAGADRPLDAWRCTERRCELTVTGSPTLEVLQRRLRAEVSGGAVRVSGGGVDVRLNPGEAAVVDGLRVEVSSVSGETARMVVYEP